MRAIAMFDRERLARFADGAAAAVAASLPWSTSATSILVPIWLLAMLPTLGIADIRREVFSARGGVPLLLIGLAVLGMSWSGAPFTQRLDGVESFLKLIAIPLLVVQFRRSANGAWVTRAFFISATLLLAASWALVLVPGLTWRGSVTGVPVKDYISQSGIFTFCVFALLDRAFVNWIGGERIRSLALAGLALLFLADIFYVSTSRTTLVVIPVLGVLFGIWRLSRLALVAFLILLIGALAAVWSTSPYVRDRAMNLVTEVQVERDKLDTSSAGMRVEWWKKSLGFIAEAPFAGHGTGSIRAIFQRNADTTVSAKATNPHNQILAVGIQLGSIGIAVLLAMWLVHFRLFIQPGFAAWLGVIVVVQNIVSSQFNSHLFDFTQGWFYVFGVGVLGGMVLREQETASHEDHPAGLMTAAAR
jgi:O-antigen ligase